MTRLFALFLAAFLIVPATAHQQKVAISEIMHNPRTDMLEVVHRVPLHDAEHSLSVKGMRGADIVSDLESRRAFARYVASKFSIEVGEAPLSLALLGSEIEGGHLLIYQEGPSPGRGTPMRVQSQILTDIWPRQVNRVNLGKGSGVQTLVFRSGDGAKGAKLP